LTPPPSAGPRSLSPVQMSSVLEQIEQQLRDMWSSPTAPGEPQRSRVCTMNLVVVASSDALASSYIPIVDTVTQSIPSRAIVVSIEAAAPEIFLEGEVAPICAAGEDTTCSERVTLRASGLACARIASAVDALVVPELPTTLVWLGRVHTDDTIFRELARGAERVVVDTQLTSFASVRSLAQWVKEQRHRGPAIADLAWTRLSTWQEMCARFFDDPAMRPFAFAVDTLRVAQVSDKGARLGPEASLLVGWLATRLGWRIERIAGALQLRRADGAPVQLVLRASPPAAGVEPLALAEVAFEASPPGSVADSGTVAPMVARGSLERELGSGGGDSDVLRYRLDVGLPCAGEHTVRLGQNRATRVLERTLHRPAHDPALAEAVAFAEQLDEFGVVCS